MITFRQGNLLEADMDARREGCAMDVTALRQGLQRWPAGEEAAQRKLRLFDNRLLYEATSRFPTGIGCLIIADKYELLGQIS